MLLGEKKEHRQPLNNAATTGKIDDSALSIDDLLRQNNPNPELNPWDTIKILGAQLCRPPMDPYREEINTITKIGKLVVDSPLLVSTTNQYALELSDKAYTALYCAMNTLATMGIRHAIMTTNIPDQYLTQRGFKAILDLQAANDLTITVSVAENQIFSADQKNQIRYADSVLLKYDPVFFMRVLGEVRHHINPYDPTQVPIFVTVTNPADIPIVLNEGIDAVVVDVQGTPIEQLRKIYEAKKIFTDYFRKRDIDRQIIFMNGPDDAGRVVKTIALGATAAHGIVYDIPSLIAYALQDATRKSSGKDGEALTGADEASLEVPYSADEIGKAIAHYLRETNVEITQLVAAAGYSNCFNVSDDNLRTSNPKVSLATHIQMEGLNKSWFSYHHDILKTVLDRKGVDIKQLPQQQVVEMVYALIPRENL